MFDRIEVWRVRRKIFNAMPSLLDIFLDIAPFMESSVVHHDHGAFRQLRDERLTQPGAEDIAVNRALE